MNLRLKLVHYSQEVFASLSVSLLPQFPSDFLLVHSDPGKACFNRERVIFKIFNYPIYFLASSFPRMWLIFNITECLWIYNGNYQTNKEATIGRHRWPTRSLVVHCKDFASSWYLPQPSQAGIVTLSPVLPQQSHVMLKRDYPPLPLGF